MLVGSGLNGKHQGQIVEAMKAMLVAGITLKSTPHVYEWSHIPQTLQLSLILFVTYIIVMRPKKAETAVYGC